MNSKDFKVIGNRKIDLTNFNSNPIFEFETKKDGEKQLKKNRKIMSELQDKFYAYDKYSLLINISGNGCRWEG